LFLETGPELQSELAVGGLAAALAPAAFLVL
jgi:hypothetical protein